MKTALLDSSFILTCVKQKIDFFEFLENEGFQIMIPKQVLNEIEKISKTKEYAKLVLQILRKNKFIKVGLKSRNVDLGIVKYAKENPKTIIATLDRGIKNKVKNNKLVIRGKKKLEVV
ncbi:MAG: PIN domain-containing protein [Nanoarchaeota archaeon]